MKTTLVIITLFSFGNLFCQEINCLSFELYNSNYDVVHVTNSLEDENELSKTELIPNSLQLIVLPNAYSEFPKWTLHKRHGIDKGFKVLLINNSSNDISLYNMDGEITIKRQVDIGTGWKNVESYDRTPYPICGNSFFTKKVIESGAQINFIAPCVEGDVKAAFRFVIFTKSQNRPSPIYSNEFDGFINMKLIE